MNGKDIYTYVKEQEIRFESDEVQVGDNWFWNFRKHVQMIFHLMHGVFYTGENNYLRAFRQIMRPFIRLSLWTEDIEVKDVVFYGDDTDDRVWSFFAKKYHDEVYVRKHNIDKMIDEIAESDVPYGGVLVQKGKERPEVLTLNSIAFCDQTDILGGPIAFKMHYSPDKLRSMSKFGWGDEKNGATISLNELCALAENKKDPVGNLNANSNNVPGKTIEVYIVRGNMPDSWLNENGDEEYHCNQLQIIAYYTDKDHKKNGVTLYRKKEDEGALKFHSSEPVYGRALGYSDGEALIHPAIWSNCMNIWKYDLLQAASKVPLVTDDEGYTQKNKIQDMENLEITTIGEGKSIQQVPTAAPGNIALYENSINDLFELAKENVQGYDSLMGKEESAGTTFRGQERLIAQGRGWHDRRRGQRAKFIEEIYEDMIIPDMMKEILDGQKFIATLSMDELNWISERMAIVEANEIVKRTILNGKLVTKEDQVTLIETLKTEIRKEGNRKLIEILRDEYKNKKVNVQVSVAGKSKNLVSLNDKVLAIFQNVFSSEMAAPGSFGQLMQNNPFLAKKFEDILEYSGMNISDFNLVLQGTQTVPQMAQPQAQAQAQPSPLQLNETANA